MMHGSTNIKIHVYLRRKNEHLIYTLLQEIHRLSTTVVMTQP